MVKLSDERELLMIPGPTNIDPKVLRSLAKPTLSHTSVAFGKIYKEAIEEMKKIFMTNGRVFIVCGSGTLAQEMGVANFLEPGDKVLVVCNGFFAERFVEICKRHRANVTRLEVEWGKVATPQRIKEELERDEYKALFVVHVETSTGTAHHIREIGKVVHDFNTLYVLDTVCSLGGMEVRVDDWHIDVCLTGSQKALAIPTGLALLATSEKAMEVYKSRKQPADFYYGDLGNWIPIMDEPTKYFATPAVNLVYALNESIKMILNEGLEARFRRHKIIAEAFRSMLKAQGLKLVADESCAADTMSAVVYPQGVDDKLFRGTLANEFNITVAGGLGPLAGKIFRVGHMGNVSPNDMLATIGAIETTLVKMGVPLEAGRGSAAAQKVIATL